MKLRILYHGNCFDGVSSAAIFTKFYRAKIHADADVQYTPTMHRAGNAFDREQFDGDENAIVDFKYCPDERLTWWFDHHQSAFLSDEDEKHFNADTSGKKFLDTTSKSCAEFIARIAKEKFDFEDDSLAELIEWAHIIDGALYESPAQCVELRSPALKLMQVIEGEKDPAFVEKIIRQLTERSLDEIVESDEIQAKLEPILEQHWETVELIKERAVAEKGVVSFDLTDTASKATTNSFRTTSTRRSHTSSRLSQSSFPHKDLGRLKPLGTAAADSQHRRDLRTLRRRRTRRGRRGLVETGGPGIGEEVYAGNN